MTLRDHLKFALKSLLGRWFLSRHPPKQEGLRFLNVGSGPRRFPGWINADFFCFQKVGRPDWMVDLRVPLPCESNYWDGIFCEHVIEHLDFDDAGNMLAELYRVLKPGCWIRIIAPDIRKYAAFYNGQPVDKAFIDKWGNPIMALHSLTQKYQHRSVWDADTLKSELEKVGFGNIQEVEYRRGVCVNIIMDFEARRYESFYVEAQKPD